MSSIFKIILYISLLSYVISAKEINVIDECIRSSWENGEWNAFGKYKNQYDNRGFIESSHFYNNINDTWIIDFKSFLTTSGVYQAIYLQLTFTIKSSVLSV